MEQQTPGAIMHASAAQTPKESLPVTKGGQLQPCVSRMGRQPGPTSRKTSSHGPPETRPSTIQAERLRHARGQRRIAMQQQQREVRLEPMQRNTPCMQTVPAHTTHMAENSMSRRRRRRPTKTQRSNNATDERCKRFCRPGRDEHKPSRVSLRSPTVGRSPGAATTTATTQDRGVGMPIAPGRPWPASPAVAQAQIPASSPHAAVALEANGLARQRHSPATSQICSRPTAPTAKAHILPNHCPKLLLAPVDAGKSPSMGQEPAGLPLASSYMFHNRRSTTR